MKKHICDFCKKSQDKVVLMVAGPDVDICDECVELAYEIVVREQEKKWKEAQK